MSEGGEMVVTLIVPRALVKIVKSTLEDGGRFGRKIEKGNVSGGGGKINDDNDSKEEFFTVFTNLAVGEGDNSPGRDLEILRTLNLNSYSSQLTLRASTPAAPPPAGNPLETAILTFLTENLHPFDIPPLLSTAPKRYSLYPPLAILPADTFSNSQWYSFLVSLPHNTLRAFYRDLATALSATHLAVNNPISASSLLRSPNLTPYHGDFGLVCNSPDPSAQELESAFWCSTVQNGIYQTWAPMYTMFSRGNIKEKARVLTFPDVRGRTAVDLYAGIGYFAFSYAAAGAAAVWCWEMNPWSCEALVRGARENGWSVKLVRREVVVGRSDVDGVRIVVFMEDNCYAVERIRGMGEEPEVGHVNLGLLPTSRGSWEAALKVVSRNGGWVHVHVNVGAGAVGEYGQVVVDEFKALDGEGREIVCRHVEEVKTFAPGVVHCVLDLYVGGCGSVIA